MNVKKTDLAIAIISNEEYFKLIINTTGRFTISLKCIELDLLKQTMLLSSVSSECSGILLTFSVSKMGSMLANN